MTQVQSQGPHRALQLLPDVISEHSVSSKPQAIPNVSRTHSDQRKYSRVGKALVWHTTEQGSISETLSDT